MGAVAGSFTVHLKMLQDTQLKATAQSYYNRQEFNPITIGSSSILLQ